MPKYTIDRFVTRQFTDLGDGISVTIRNPRMCPERDLVLELDFSADRAVIERRTNAFLAGFITDWQVPDPNDTSDDPVLLGSPDADTLGRAPAEITLWIGEQVKAARHPR